MPVLSTRIEKGNQLAGSMINGMGSGPFEFIATITGRSQIVPIMTTTGRPGDNMVNDQGDAHQPARSATILTAVVSLSRDLLSKHLWNGRHGSLQGQFVECRYRDAAPAQERPGIGFAYHQAVGSQTEVAEFLTFFRCDRAIPVLFQQRQMALLLG